MRESGLMASSDTRTLEARDIFRREREKAQPFHARSFLIIAARSYADTLYVCAFPLALGREAFPSVQHAHRAIEVDSMMDQV